MSVASLADRTLRWRRVTLDPAGGAAVVTDLGSLTGRVQPGKGAEALQYGRDLELTPVVVYVAGSPAIEPQDELVGEDGTVFLVRHVQDPNLLGRFVAVTCEVQR